MDAFTQLLESYLSSSSNFYSDLLATEGLRHIAGSLLAAYRDGKNLEARSGMAMAAYLSGITLTNVGLGLVHGIAGIIGGYKNIPHGIICSAVMSACNNITVRLLRKKASWHPALIKYATAGKIFCDEASKSDAYYTDYLLDLIARWVAEMKIPKLSAFAITRDDLQKFAREAENKNNPLPLNVDEIHEALELSM
jgi:alcohol dehydrogenase class IV